MKSYIKFLRRNKAYAIIDILGLALSMTFIILIGAYTWQETHIDSQHSKADRMYAVCLDIDGEKVSGGHWRLIRKLMDAFPEIESGTGIVGNSRWLQTVDGDNVSTNAIYVDSTFFDIFDFELVRGDRNTALSSANSIVVTEDYARRVWGDEDPVGKTILFNIEEEPLTVSAVMAPIENSAIMFGKDMAVDALIPFPMVRYYNYSLYDENMSNSSGAEIILLAREGADLKARSGQYDDFLKEDFWILSLPGMDCHIEIEPYRDLYFSDYQSADGSLQRGNGKMVKLLFTVGLVILLFALINYINLTVALSAYRAKEMATRRLLGDSRNGIFAKLIGESTLLCIVSFAIGLGLAVLARPYAEKLLDRTISFATCITPTTVAIAIGTILLTGLLAGMIPAILISSVKPVDIVRGSFRRSTKMVFGKVFIVIQNVVTITMIASAITMYMQIGHMVKAPLGYDTDGIMYVGNGGVQEHNEEFIQRVSALSSVELVSACRGYPLQGGNNETMTWNNRTISFQTFVGDENFMKIFGLGLERDNGSTETVKTYLNRQALAELGLEESAETYPFYGDEEPLAGIVRNFHIRTILDEQHPLRVQITDRKNMYPWGFAIKVSGDEAATFEQIEEIFEDVYKWEIKDSSPYLNQKIERHFAPERNLSAIVAIFAVIAIIISMLGLVAMSTYFVQQRRSEIAVKKVFGCESRGMLRGMVLQFMSYVAVAFVIACPLIYGLMNSWLSEYSYRIGVYWWIYAAAGLGSIVISVMSVYVQSRRAAGENPVNALYHN